MTTVFHRAAFVASSIGIAAALLFCAPDVKAQYYWSGGGSSDNISDGNNWFGGSNPTSGGSLNFNNTTGSHDWAYFNYGSGDYFSTITIYNGATGSGGILKFYGPSTDTIYAYEFQNYNDPVLLVIAMNIGSRTSPNEPLTLNSGVAGTGSTSGGIQVQDNITLQASQPLYLQGTSQIEIDGVVQQSGGTSSMIIGNDGSTPYILDKGTITLGGTVYIDGGTLELQNASPSSSLAAIDVGSTTGSSSSMLRIDSGVTVSTPITVVSGNSGNSTLSMNATGAGTFSGAITLNKSVSADVVSGGSLTLSAAITGSGGLTKTSGGTLTFSATNTYSGGTGISNGTLAVTTFGAVAGNMQVANGATLNLLGGVTTGALLTNLGVVIGYGGISNSVVNNGSIFAITNGASAGTLTVTEASTINGSTATVGTIGTNAVLNLLTPGASAFFVNNGTILVSGGTILLNSGTGGTISNFNILAGVGVVSNLPIVNVAGSSLIAEVPIPGLSNLIANVSVTNQGLLAAITNNLSSGAATLSLAVGGGGMTYLVNATNGVINLNGGFITFNGGQSGVTNLGLIFGAAGAESNLNVANLGGASVMASNGALRFGALNNLNQGCLSNFSSSATLVMTNTILQNTGTIALNGGGLIMGGSVITNDGTIIGPGNYSSGLYNATDGTVIAQSGTLAIATNGPATESVANAGTISIQNGSTLQVGGTTPVSWNNLTTANGTGQVILAGGVLTGGAVTNTGTISGNGTIDSVLVNAAGGTLTASGGNLTLTNNPTQNGNVAITSGSTLTMALSSGTFTNGGTINLSGGVMVFTNTVAGTTFTGTFINNGVIAGFGTNSLNPTFSLHEGSGFNPNFVNSGVILASNGLLMINAADSFTQGGFSNAANGTIAVSNGATFAVNKTGNYWNNGGPLANQGTVVLNGGTVTLYYNGFETNGGGNASIGIVNNGTIIAQGTGTATNTWGSGLLNKGTIYITNNNVFSILTMNAVTNNTSGQIFLGALNASGSLVATNAGQNGNNFGNQGLIEGQGTITLGVTNANNTTAPPTGGANAHFLNTGTLIATNWGGGGGTLFISTGNAYSGGGFENLAGGVVQVATNTTLEINRSYQAWSQSGNTVTNLGAITMGGGTLEFAADGVQSNAAGFINNGSITGNGVIIAGVTNAVAGTIAPSGGTLTINGSGGFGNSGTFALNAGNTLVLTNLGAQIGLTFSNAGTIQMSGGELLAGVITNAGTISGFGTISGGGVANLNNSFLFASNGVLSASLGSFTNGIGATMGTLTTNATLNVQMPGGAGQSLINRGTLSFAGGTLLANGTSTGTITNTSTGVIMGVGDVTQSVLNQGTIMAANPVSGLNVFSVGLSDPNLATIGASNNAILNVVLSGGVGSTFNNNGSIAMIGGTLVISNGTPGVITNTLFVGGVGTITPNIFNNSTIEATVNGGALDVSLLGGTNGSSGYLGAGTGATLQFENSSLVNQGTIGPVGVQGGTIQFGPSVVGGILSNLGTIQGINGLAFNAFVQNNNYIYATNGTVSFNAVNGLGNAGTIDIGNGGTFQSNSSNSWANAGTINMLGGTLRTGGFTNAAGSAIFTNSNLIVGYGTIIGGGAYGQTGAGFDKSFANLGTILATNPISGTAQTLYITTGGATTGNGIENLGNMIVSSNNTLALDRGGLPILNTGTITINNGILASTSTITNTGNGIIQGYGTLTASIVNQSGGTIRATNGLLSMTSTVFPVNQGTFEIDNNATLTWDATNSWKNQGTVSLLGGTLRTGGPTNVDAGGEPFTNLNYMVGFGTIIGGGAFNTNGVGFDKAILNLGTIVADGGTLTIYTGVSTLSNGIANFGTMIVSNPTDTLVLERAAQSGLNSNFVLNTGTILINGGTLTANTAITNQFLSTSLPGLIQGYGTIALTNQLVNLGTILSTNTTLTGNGVLQFVNPIGSALQINQSGTLAVEAGSQMIFGSNTNAPLLNGGTIVMAGGTLSSGVLTNNFGATFEGFGTITSSIFNSGTGLATSVSASLNLTGNSVFNQTSGVLGANNGRLLVDAVFTNAGTVSFINSVGTFASAVINQGAWISDPSTNVFLSNYTVATNGYISMASGDVYEFQSNFVNVSTLSNQYNTLNGKFVMNGQGTQQFYVAGINLGGFRSSLQSSNETYFTTGGGTFSTNSFSFARGDSAFGYSNNFALGTLELSDLSTTVLASTYDVFDNSNLVAGLYLNTLTLDPGSLLIISNNVELYFQNTNGVTGIGFGTLGAGDNVLLLDGSSFHQLTMVPEPSVLMLMTIGAVSITYYRRRRGRRVSK